MTPQDKQRVAAYARYCVAQQQTHPDRFPDFESIFKECLRSATGFKEQFLRRHTREIKAQHDELWEIVAQEKGPESA